jgi:hypothetical protein
MINYRDRAMQCLYHAAYCERFAILSEDAIFWRERAALWFRRAADQTPSVKPQVAA